MSGRKTASRQFFLLKTQLLSDIHSGEKQRIKNYDPGHCQKIADKGCGKRCADKRLDSFQKQNGNKKADDHPYGFIFWRRRDLEADIALFHIEPYGESHSCTGSLHTVCSIIQSDQITPV